MLYYADRRPTYAPNNTLERQPESVLEQDHASNVASPAPRGHSITGESAASTLETLRTGVIVADTSV